MTELSLTKAYGAGGLSEPDGGAGRRAAVLVVNTDREVWVWRGMDGPYEVFEAVDVEPGTDPSRAARAVAAQAFGVESTGHMLRLAAWKPPTRGVHAWTHLFALTFFRGEAPGWDTLHGQGCWMDEEQYRALDAREGLSLSSAETLRCFAIAAEQHEKYAPAGRRLL